MEQELSKPRWPVAAFVVATALACGPGSVNAQQAVRGQELAGDSEVEVFIQLDTPSVAEFNATAVAAGGEMPDAAVQRQQAARVTEQQARFRAQLAAYGATELSTQRVGANGFRVRVRADQVASLRNLSGVRTVGRVATHVLDNVDSVPWVGAPQFWATYGKTGEGVTIAVIDTGIDYLHAGFGGPGTADAYNANSRNVIEPGTFPTTKVIGGFDFAGPTYDASVPALNVPAPDPDPLDRNGHGSHVAGTAAGLGVPGIVGTGVAPGASLYALKVFGDVAGSTNLTSLAIEWAMDPNGDGDMSDHVDVINMSLGSPFATPEDPSAISAQRAAELGIIVVTSAGNENDVPYITGAPGLAPAAISTAATVPGGRLFSRFTVNSPASLQGVRPSLEGAGPVTLAQAGPITDDLVAAAPLNGCGALTNAAAVSGNIAFIVRGVCGFIDKYRNAQNAGARAIVVFNDGATPDRVEPIVMGGLDATITIPGLMISSTAGNAILAGLQTGAVNATLDIARNPLFEDQIATFSSRGPGQGGSIFKPDLSAPGVGIVSVGVGSGNGPAVLQGTSMASPHVAGAAALLHQLYPDYGQEFIKAMLQNSTSNANPSGDTDIARQGVGVLRIPAAAALTSYAAPGGVSFGRINPTGTVTRVQLVDVMNLANTHRNFSVTHVPKQTYPGVTVSCPSNVRLDALRSKRVEVRLRFDPKVAFTQGRFDLASISQTEVDGWCILSDGTDTLRVAYVAVVDPASRTQIQVLRGNQTIRVRNTGPTVAWAEGFTFNSEGAPVDPQNHKAHAIENVGFRTVDPTFDDEGNPIGLYGADPVLELAIETHGNYEHLSARRYDLYLDTNGDGAEDTRLRAVDLSAFNTGGPNDVDPGVLFVTAQFPYANGVTGGGSLDWAVNGWDFNDSVVILPFTRVGGTGGRVPNAFSYRLVVTDSNDVTQTHSGTINLADEVSLDASSIGLAPNDSFDANVTGGHGSVLWLLPNDAHPQQSQRAYWVTAP
jgi:minor extracellular serine protease Vpr